MVKDAETHADEDKHKKELVEVRNQADGLAYTTEKSLKEHGDKIDEETRKKIEEALEDLKKVMEGDNLDEIKQKTEALATASHKLAEAMYKQEEAGAAGAEGAAEGAEAADEGVVDAEFEEVDEDKA
jgi:molecular chaperone DnaK